MSIATATRAEVSTAEKKLRSLQLAAKKRKAEFETIKKINL
jgi:hypothetical protein